jgi:hypothetical protein
VTQLDLPQLSLERYVDLVRRRRWQLVPISLLGLVVGGLVAFFIPRYYVAEITVEHKAAPDQLHAAPGEDPFRSVVNNAQDTIKLAAGDAMRALRWPEGLAVDPSERTLNEKQVQERIQVVDNNAHVRDRSYALIRVLYRDRDGDRSAAFANALVKTWMEQQIGDMRTAAEAAKRRAVDSAASIDQTHEALSHDKRDVELRYGIRPDYELSVQRETFADQQKAHGEEVEKLRGLRAQRAALVEQIDSDLQRQATMPDRLEPDAATIAKLVKGDGPLERLLFTVEYKKLGLAGWLEGTPKRLAKERELAQAEQLFRMALVTVGANPDGTLPNPEFKEIQQRLDTNNAERKKVESLISQLEESIEREGKRLAGLRDAYEQLARIERQLDQCKVRREAAQKTLGEVEQTLNRLTAEPPIKPLQQAQVPPHPTDPNIMLVALIGCVLGLGVAVGLILLLDVLQGSFKTVDDVERGLQVPVLGGLSHLETAEERQAAARSRRRAAAAAFGFVGLVVVVVAIFYVAPTRLPAVVRDLLALLLGT